jgi:hypothetical protein
MTTTQEINKEILLKLGRKNFYPFCRLLAPDFYTPDRTYLKEICNELEHLYYTENGRLAIHVAPRHGKTRTICLFVAWILGQNPNNQIITCTYNQLLSSRMGKDIRDLIGTKVLGSSSNNITFKDFFPDISINPRDSSKSMWALKGRNFNFLATSPSGTATGVGCNFLIIDDIIKNHLEAISTTHKSNLWEWYVNTLQSRMQQGCRIIVVNTRWAVDDIGGMLNESEPNKWKRIIYPAYNEQEDKMLCEDIKSLEEFKVHMEKAKMNQHSWAIFRANYFQEPVSFSMSNIFNSVPEFEEIPQFERYIGYIDVANGGDYLCFIIAGIYQNKIYVVDVVYEQEKIEVTVPLIIDKIKIWLEKQNIYFHLQIETNGAMGFYNYLESQLNINSLPVYLHTLHNRTSKQQRINNVLISGNLYFMFHKSICLIHSKFYEDLISYNPKGRNKHDDAPDSIAGLLKLFMDYYNNNFSDGFSGWSY